MRSRMRYSQKFVRGGCARTITVCKKDPGTRSQSCLPTTCNVPRSGFELALRYKAVEAEVAEVIRRYQELKDERARQRVVRNS